LLGRSPRSCRERRAEGPAVQATLASRQTVPITRQRGLGGRSAAGADETDKAWRTVVMAAYRTQSRPWRDGYLDGVACSGAGLEFLSGGRSGTRKFLPHLPQRTLWPRVASCTCNTLRHIRFGQMIVIAIDQQPPWRARTDPSPQKIGFGGQLHKIKTRCVQDSGTCGRKGLAKVRKRPAAAVRLSIGGRP
jgi:hypothetical protein